jgi:hypothetical protein
MQVSGQRPGETSGVYNRSLSAIWRPDGRSAGLSGNVQAADRTCGRRGECGKHVHRWKARGEAPVLPGCRRLGRPACRLLLRSGLRAVAPLYLAWTFGTPMVSFPSIPVI